MCNSEICKMSICITWNGLSKVKKTDLFGGQGQTVSTRGIQSGSLGNILLFAVVISNLASNFPFLLK